MKLENDYGVDVGLLIDMHARAARIRQVDIGFLEHDSQPLENLGRMAAQVIRTILDRAARLGRLTEYQLVAVQESQRVASADLESIFRRLGNPEKLALLDMDGTLIAGRYAEELAKATSREYALNELLDNDRLAPEDRTRRIASVLANIPQSTFEDVAMNLPLTKGAVDLVVGLRKRGFAVGIISDSFYVATEVIRRRVFADFSVAHLLQFVDGESTGAVTISAAMQHARGCKEHRICKRNFVNHLVEHCMFAPQIVAVGDNDGDACLLQTADLGIAFEPKTHHVANCANQVIRGNLAYALDRYDREVATVDAQWTPPYYAAKLAGDGL